MNTELKVSLVQDIKLFDYKFNFSSFLTKLNLLSLFLYWKRDNLRVPKKVQKTGQKNTTNYSSSDGHFGPPLQGEILSLMNLAAPATVVAMAVFPAKPIPAVPAL